MSHIPMMPVTSSQIHSLGHDPATNTLRIQFANRKDGTPGSVYDYANVDAAIHAAMVKAESVGSHFGKHIKPHADKYPYKKVVPAQNV